jgi:hypothetical protein
VVAQLHALEIDRLSLATLAALQATCAAVEARIAVRFAQVAAERPARTDTGPETFLSVKAAAIRLGVAPKWLYRRKNKLPFMREIAPGTWRVAVTPLERWMAARRPAPDTCN